MSTPARILYATQNAVIFPNSGQAAFFSLPINSVSLDVTNPIENVLVLGQLGAAARLQKEASKTKISIKSYLTSGTVSGAGGVSTAFNKAAITGLTGNALAGNYSKIVLDNYGFTGYGVLTKLDLDASSNNFVMLDLTFEGVGSPDTQGIPTTISNSSYAGVTTVVSGVTPVTSDLVGAGVLSTDGLFTGAKGTNITGAGIAACVSTAKFSLDIPTEVITCLGAQFIGSQTIVSQGNVMVGKPPFKATLTVEGTAASACDTVDFGTIIVSLPTPRLISNTINQSVGSVGQTYNYTIEDVTCTFTDSALTGGSQPSLTN